MVIDAPPEVVFDCFCDPRALITWMGDRAEVDPRPGGVFDLDINGVLIRGHYAVVDKPRRVVFSWGTPGNPDLPPDASEVEVTLEPQGAGTYLTLVHRGLPPRLVDIHGVGWGHFLERLAIAATGADAGPDTWDTDPPGAA